MNLINKLEELEYRIQQVDYTNASAIADILLELVRCVRDLEAGTRAEMERLQTQDKQ